MCVILFSLYKEHIIIFTSECFIPLKPVRRTDILENYSMAVLRTSTFCSQQCIYSLDTSRESVCIYHTLRSEMQANILEMSDGFSQTYQCVGPAHVRNGNSIIIHTMLEPEPTTLVMHHVVFY